MINVNLKPGLLDIFQEEEEFYFSVLIKVV